jgi:ribosomal 50S subunit-recycling heat shock protein
MRLDKFLVVARLVKQRSRAKELCDAGHVKAAGKTAKASHDVRAGDVYEVTSPRRRLVLRVLVVPTTKSVPKDEAAGLYEVIADERATTPGSAVLSGEPPDEYE